MEELVIAIDTSGSCSAATVRRFMEETYGILSDHENFFRKMNLYIIQCDSFIQDVIHVTCEDDWKNYLTPYHDPRSWRHRFPSCFCICAGSP